jgi:hypothetical protein
MNKEFLLKIAGRGYRVIRVLGLIYLAVNVVLLIAHSLSDKDYLVIRKPEAGQYAAYSIVNAPARFDHAGALTFVPFALDLRQGDSAFIQSGVRKNGLQRDSSFSFSYDKIVISVKSKKTGAVITATAPGQTLLEAVVDGNITPVCLITVK